MRCLACRAFSRTVCWAPAKSITTAFGGEEEEVRHMFEGLMSPSLGGSEEKLETTELYRVDSPPETTVAFDLLCVAATIYHLGVGQIPPSPKGQFESAVSAGSTLTMKIVRACLQPNASALGVFRFILEQQPGLKLWAEEELLPIAKV